MKRKNKITITASAIIGAIAIIILLALIIKPSQEIVREPTGTETIKSALVSLNRITSTFFIGIPQTIVDEQGYICCDSDCSYVCTGSFAECKSICSKDVCLSSSHPRWCDTGHCGISEKWCELWRNQDDLHCSLDGSRCCIDPEHIYDYSADMCCYPDQPYYWDIEDGCVNWRTPNADNWYTRASECKYDPNSLFPPHTEQKCVGKEYWACSGGYLGQFLDGWDKRIEKGKCGVECLSDTEKCEGKVFYTCTPDYTWGEQGKIIGKCGVICTEGDLKCEGDDIVICENNEFILKETCEFGCENEVCKEPEPSPIGLIIAIIVIFIFVGIFIFFIIKRRKKR